MVFCAERGVDDQGDQADERREDDERRTTASPSTHQTALVAHASPLAVGVCQKEHLVHLEPSDSVQCVAFVKWTHPN